METAPSPRHKMLRLPRHRERSHHKVLRLPRKNNALALTHCQSILRLSRKTRKRPPILWFDTAKKSISCETSSTFHTLKVRCVLQCECTAQWREINELATSCGDDEATTTRRRGDDDTRKTKRTQVQPQTPTINGNPSLRIREYIYIYKIYHIPYMDCWGFMITS